MTAFAKPSDLALYLTGAEWCTGAELSQAKMILELVSEDIRAAARNQITKSETVPETIKLAGTWQRDLTIPGAPIQSVSSVEVNGVPVDYTFNGRETLRIGAGTLPTALSAFDEGPAGTIGQGAQGQPDFDTSTGHWGGPTSTVSVVVTRGYEADEIPGFVASMAVRVAARTIGNPTMLSQETLGPYSSSYGQVLAAGGSHLTDKETKLLRRKFSRTAGTAKAGSVG